MTDITTSAKLSAPSQRLVTQENTLKQSELSKVIETKSMQQVLVIDDDEFQHKIISSALKGMNYHLLFATSGIEALSILHKTSLDLILVDYMMPGMDGIEVVRKIKAVSSCSEIPIVMMTGKQDKRIAKESLEAGVNSFITKPVARSVLIDKIKKILTKGWKTI